MAFPALKKTSCATFPQVQVAVDTCLDEHNTSLPSPPPAPRVGRWFRIPTWWPVPVPSVDAVDADRMIDAFDLVLIVDSNEPSDLREAVETLAKNTRFKLLR